MEIRGSIVAIVTPFKNGNVDETALAKLVKWHIEQGTDGIVPCGTTGESATLSHDEHDKVIDVVVKAAGGKIPVIAGTGSNNTEEAIRLTKHAETAGADAALVIAPYYNKPTQRGLFEHFRKVADSVKIPIVLYNIASRTGINIEPETMKRLVDACKNIIAVKEASGSLDQMTRIRALCGDKLTIISGDDALLLPILAIGGKGVISVAANILPKDMSDYVKAFESGDLNKAREYYYKLYPLIKNIFIETNPGPIKEAMKKMGLCEATLRLPLYEMEDNNKQKLFRAMKDYGII
ncbi:MAG: 4-hydroxy-tetrahydrodipicolinate synthase [Elusimicrobiota bacterium]